MSVVLYPVDEGVPVQFNVSYLLGPSSAPYDFTGKTVTARIENTSGGVLLTLAPEAIVVNGPGSVSYTLSWEQVQVLIGASLSLEVVLRTFADTEDVGSPVLFISSGDDDCSEYIDKITPFFRGSPNFTAMVCRVTSAIVRTRSVVIAVPYAYDLDQAIGAQLDVCGEWVGRSRKIIIPLENYWFSLDIEGLGLDEGVWYNEYDPTTGLASLNDDDYRRIIRAKILANNWNGLIETLPEIIEMIVGDTNTKVFVDDSLDMSYVVGLSRHIPGLIALSVLDSNGIPTQPGGVHQEILCISEEGTSLFGFDVDNEYIGGLDGASWGVDPSVILGVDLTPET